jgi:hypothetical protein
MVHIDAYLPECVSHMNVANDEEDIEDMQTLADPGLWEDLASLALRDMIITARFASTHFHYLRTICIPSAHDELNAETVLPCFLARMNRRPKTTFSEPGEGLLDGKDSGAALGISLEMRAHKLEIALALTKFPSLF